MNILSLFKRNIVKFYKHAVWLAQYIYLNKTTRNYKVFKKEINFNYNEKILIIVPHADDELIGCYQIIKKYKKNVRLFYFGFTGENESEKNYNTRLSEFKKFCKISYIPYYISNSSHTIFLQNTVNTYKPDIIFTPSLVDWHDEHFLSNKILFEIITNLNEKITIYQYQISVPIPREYISHFVSMNKSEQLQKWLIFKTVYNSQINIPIYRFILNEKISGCDVLHYATESFVKLNKEDFKRMLNYFNNYRSNNNFEQLKYSINNLIKVRKTSYELLLNYYQKYTDEII